MLTIKAKQIDDRKNKDMIMLSVLDGTGFALTHIDMFLKDGGEGKMYFRLYNGEELTLSVAIAGEEDE